MGRKFKKKKPDEIFINILKKYKTFKTINQIFKEK